MKKNFRFALMISLFAVIFGISESVIAQNTDVPMVGGFKTVSVKDQGVVNATNFAMNKIAEDEEMDLTLLSILKAEQQVVQGMNYKVLFKTSYADGGEKYDLCINAKVYRSLKNIYTVSSWDSIECSEVEN